MKLYYFALSPYSQKVLIALDEKGVEIEKQHVNLFDENARQEFKQIYPLGKLPLLVPDDSFVPESAIIIEYIEDTYPDKGTRLIPEQAQDARRVRFKSLMADNYVSPPARELFFQSLKDEQDKDAALIEKNRNTLDTMYGYMNKSAEHNQWMHGDGFTMADCTSIPALNLANQLHPIGDDKAALHRYLEKGKERDSVKQVLAHAEAVRKAASI